MTSPEDSSIHISYDEKTGTFLEVEDDKHPEVSSQDNENIETHTLPATLIRDAAASRNIQFKTDERSVRSYLLFNHGMFKVLLYTCLWGNLLLAIFEKPAIVVVPFWATMILEAVFLTFFSVRLGHASCFQEKSVFWKDPKNITTLLIIVLTVADMVGYCVWLTVTPSSVAARAVRWSRPLRPLLLVNFPEGRQIRKAFRNIRRTLPDILHVLVLFFSSMALFALLALKLFQNRHLTYPRGRPYFQNYWDSFWDLYVLVTTANNPDVKMPSYDVNNWYAIFFMVYLLVNLFLFMNIVLAVIYNNYKKHLKNEVHSTLKLKRQLLMRAFDLLKTSVDSKDVVTKKTWHAVMAMVDPMKSPIQVDLLLSVLDTKGNHSIDRNEFLKVADLLNIGLTVKKTTGTVFERCCSSCYTSKYSEMVKTGIRTRYFQFAFDILILANAICIGLNYEVMEWFFLAAFSVEIILKLYAYGPVKYFTTFWNIFDFAVIFAAWVVTIVGTAMGKSEMRMTILDVLMVLRILRLIRLTTSIDRFKVVLVTIVNIGPSILTYGTVIFVVFYIYAIIGMEIFHGRVQYLGYNSANETALFCGNPALNGSEFATKRYCSNGFNNVAQTLVLLFDLLVVNQWHVLAEGFVLVTHKAARLYFITFHATCAIILLNIFTAFVLEAFILEYTLSKGHLESILETRIKELGLGVGQKSKMNVHKKSDRQDLVENMECIDDVASEGSTTKNVTQLDSTSKPEQSSEDTDAGLRFCLNKNRSKRLETLLQLMFEGDFNMNDQQSSSSKSNKSLEKEQNYASVI